MSESKLPLMIGIGTRIRKSPYYESNLKYGVTGFTVYNKMYLPTSFSSPEKEYESLINDVTFGDFAAERQIEINGPDAHKFVCYVQPRNLEKCAIGACKYILLTDMILCCGIKIQFLIYLYGIYNTDKHVSQLLC